VAINRVDSQPSLLRELKKLERRQREKKELQIVGADAVKTFLVKTENEWDCNEVLPLSPELMRQKEFTVIFRPNNKAAGLDLHTKNELVGMSNTKPQITFIRRRVTDIKSQQWRVRVKYYGDQAVRVKFFVSATGKGTLTVI
jgi:hypothetical protein